MELISDSNLGLIDICTILADELYKVHCKPLCITLNYEYYSYNKFSCSKSCTLLWSEYNEIKTISGGYKYIQLNALPTYLIKLLTLVNSALKRSSYVYNIDDKTKSTWDLYSLYTNILDDLCTWGLSIVALYGHYVITRITQSDKSLYTLNFITRQMVAKWNGIVDCKATLQMILFKSILLSDVNDTDILRIIGKCYGASLYVTMLPFMHYMVNYADIKSVSVTDLIKYMANSIYHLVSLKTPATIDVFKRYYLLLIKLMIKYECYTNNVYVHSAPSMCLHIIADYTSGVNSYAYKLYKYLSSMPTSKLSSHDASFVLIMRSLLYSPDGPGALDAAEDFQLQFSIKN
jgi:hypothetical protein